MIQAAIANPGGDREAEYGYRHLLEHLVAAREPELDRQLETVGGTIGASTGRDLMRFWVSVPPSDLAMGLNAMKALLKPITLRADDVAQERTILAREIGMLTAEERGSVRAWEAIYGADGRDPIGVSASFADATAEGLERLWRGMLVGPRLSLFASGPLDLDSTVDRLERLARTFPDGPAPEWSGRTPVVAGSAGAGAFALAVGSVDQRTTLATLATALALASEVEGSSVTYTPSPRDGVVLLQNPAASDELRRVVHRGDTGLRNRSLNLARRWIANRLDDAEGSSELRATLAAFRAGLVPERLSEVLAGVREPDLDAAFARWKALAP